MSWWLCIDSAFLTCIILIRSGQSISDSSNLLTRFEMSLRMSAASMSESDVILTRNGLSRSNRDWTDSSTNCALGSSFVKSLLINFHLGPSSSEMLSIAYMWELTANLLWSYFSLMHSIFIGLTFLVFKSTVGLWQPRTMFWRNLLRWLESNDSPIPLTEF